VDKSGYLLRANTDQLDVFGILSHQTTGHQVRSQEAVQILCTVARSRIETAQSLDLLREMANLLLQFAAHRFNGFFAGIDATSRYLQKKLAHRMTELADQEDIALCIEDYYSYTIGVLHHLSSCSLAVGFLYGVNAYVHRAPSVVWTMSSLAARYFS